jgi:hypothetical protein
MFTLMPANLVPFGPGAALSGAADSAGADAAGGGADASPDGDALGVDALHADSTRINATAGAIDRYRDTGSLLLTRHGASNILNARRWAGQ